MKMKNNSKIIKGYILDQLNIDKIKDIDYYKNETSKGTGKFLKKEDTIEEI